MTLPSRLANSLAGDEGDELGDALLQGLLGVLGDLAVGRHGLLHDAADVGDGEEPVLLPDPAPATAPRAPAVVAPAVGHRPPGNPRSIVNQISLQNPSARDRERGKEEEASCVRSSPYKNARARAGERRGEKGGGEEMVVVGAVRRERWGMGDRTLEKARRPGPVR